MEKLAKVRDEGIRLSTRELASTVAHADAEIARAQEVLEAKTASLEVVFTTDEVKTLEKLAAKIANLEERVGELPETSAAAADVRHRMEALRNQGYALRASAVIMRGVRVGVLRRSVDAQVKRLREHVAERRVKHSRAVAALKAQYLQSSKATANDFLERARAWLEEADKKLATLKDAQKARGRFGLSSLLGLGRGPKSPTAASAASPRSPGSLSPRGASGASSPPTSGATSSRGAAGVAAPAPAAHGAPPAATPARAASPA